MDPVAVLIISALATARVWRALLRDDIGFWFRDRKTSNRPKVWEFLTCPWCFGFWIAVAFVTLGVTLPAWAFLLVAGPFAVNYVSANLNIRTGDKE